MYWSFISQLQTMLGNPQGLFRFHPQSIGMTDPAGLPRGFLAIVLRIKLIRTCRAPTRQEANLVKR